MFFEHMFGDIVQFSEYEHDEKNVQYAVKMIMLSASYEEIINSSPSIRDIIETENNDTASLKRFRKWEDYYCGFCTAKTEHGDECTVKIIDCATKSIIWTFKLK